MNYRALFGVLALGVAGSDVAVECVVGQQLSPGGYGGGGHRGDVAICEVLIPPHDYNAHMEKAHGFGRRLKAWKGNNCVAGILAAAFAVVGWTFAPTAHASFLPPEMMDQAAWYIAWFVIVFVPILAITLFWLVHVLPEKIAHKRHHPQRDAIHTLCLLSLAFGGLLWPIAWLWAYTKPVTYKLAYGTEKHDDYFHEMGEKAQAGELLEHELAHLHEELDALAAKGGLSPRLKVLRRDLAALKPASGVPVSSPEGGTATGPGA